MKLIFLIGLSFLFGCAGTRPPEKTNWVEEQMAAMSLRQKIGQIMIPSLSPRFYNSEAPQIKELIRLIHDYQVGGVILFGGEPYATARTIERLQDHSALPLLIMSDVEWGLAMRVRGATGFLQNMAIGATGNEEYAYQAGKITAVEAKSIGVHIGFAPVLDVNNNPDNIIINTRAYGDSPYLVAKFGSAFIRGFQENGLYATAKHYPGHGDTEIDSHLSMPIIDASKARLEQVELPPFRAAVKTGVKAVMVGHSAYSAIPEMEGRPATLDPYFIKKILRGEMQFDGLVVTDAMSMGGVSKNYWSGEAAVRAINAGVDLVLMPTNFAATFEFTLKAAQQSRIAMTTIDSAVRRILQAKLELGLDKRPRIDLKKLEQILASPENLASAEQMANASITLLRDERNQIPLQAEKLKTALALTITDNELKPEVGKAFVAQLAKRIPVVKTARIDPRTDIDDINKIVAQFDSVDAVIAGVFVKWGSYKGSASLPDSTAKLLKNVLQSPKMTAVVSFGSPYVLRQFPETSSFLCAYGTEPLAVRAAARALFGEIPVKATLPVSIPGCHKAGDGLTRSARKMQIRHENVNQTPLREAYAVLEKAIADSIFPGAQLAIVKNGNLLASRSFGRQTYDPQSTKITTETIYDLASVTKVAATTITAMMLWEKNRLLLDTPLRAYLPAFTGGDKGSVTVRHLLTHSSGAHWWVDLWNKAATRAEAIDYIYKLPLDYAPGDSMIYSDLGLILIGEVLETITGKRINELADQMIYQPMGMKNTRYNPPRNLLPRIAPTEIGGSMHRALIHGDVHDENTHFFGGVSTHAGLFSTAEDLAALAQMLINGGIYKNRRFLMPGSIDYWTAKQNITKDSPRALGWLAAAVENSSSGDLFSEGSFGHTGFTGTSIWIDPNREIAVILLTNRVHPTRERGGMYAVRRAFHNAVMTTLIADKE